MRRIALEAVLVGMLLWTASASAQTPEYFPFPTGYLISNFGVAADGAGDIWFSAQGPAEGGPQPKASLARLVPSQATPGTSNGITFYPTPDPLNPNCCATQVRSVAYSAKDNRVYFVRSDGVVGYAVPASVSPGTTTGFSFAHLAGSQDLWDVAAAPNGGAWFTEHSAYNLAPFYGDRIAFYDGGSVQEGPSVAIQNGNTSINGSRYNAQPAGVAVDATNKPWFVEENAGFPGYRIATYPGAGDNYLEYLAQPCQPSPQSCSGELTGSGLRDLTIAKDGTIWFTNELKRTFGRFDPATLQITQFTLASVDPKLANGRPRTITTAPDGTVWMAVNESFFSTTQGNAIVKIVPAATPADDPTATVFKLAGTMPPLGVGADNAGNIWFGVGNPSPPSMVGRLAGVVGTGPPGPGPGPTPPPAPAPGSPAPVVLKPASVGIAKLTPPQVGNGAIDANQICVGPPQDKCALVYLIREREYVKGFPNTKGSAAAKKKKKAKPKPRVLGTKTVTINGGQTKKVRVTLNSLGRRILKKNKKLVVVFTATQKLANGKTKTVTKKTLTFRRR